MRNRVADLVGPPAEKMWVSTFHSACLRILRANADRLGYRSAFTVYDDTDSRRLIEMITAELGFDQKRLPSRAVQGVISQAKSELIDFETFREDARSGPDPFRKRIADVYAQYQGRLLAANALDFDDLLMVTANLLAGLRRRARQLPGALPAHPRRRVPGHEPRAERDRQAAGRGARQRLRGGRLRPVRLPLARRRHPQHPGVRARLPQRDDHHAGAELPLDPDHPRCRQRRHRQQRRPPAQGALHRRRHGRPGHALPGRGRARRGELGRQRDPAPARVGRAHVGRLRRLLPHQRAEPAARALHASSAASPTRWSVGRSSTTAGRSRTSSPSSACWPTPTTRCRPAASSTSPSAASATRRWPAWPPGPRWSTSPSARPSTAPRRRGSRARRSRAPSSSPRRWPSCARWCRR